VEAGRDEAKRFVSEPADHRSPSDNQSLSPGRHIEVRDRFTGTWSFGFDVAEVLGSAYRVRRLSDGAVLPVAFQSGDVRPRDSWKRGFGGIDDDGVVPGCLNRGRERRLS